MMRSVVATILILTCTASLPVIAQAKDQAASVSRLEPALQKLVSYEYGQDFQPLAEVMEFVRAAKDNSAALSVLEDRLIAFLDSPATLEGKKFVCEQLSLIGTKTSVPVLAKMLGDPNTSDMARYALERIPATEAGAALRAALDKVSGKHKVGIINSLGQRRDAQSVSLLVALLKDPDQSLALAAVNALGFIGDDAALKALDELRKTAPEPARAHVLDAYIRCLEQLARRGEKDKAFEQDQDVYASGGPATVQVAALRGMASLDGDQAIPILSQALQNGGDAVRAAAIESLVAIPSPEVTRLLTAAYGTLPALGRVQLLAALANRGDPATSSLLAAALTDEAREVRVAGLEGLGKLGDASHALLLAKVAAESDGSERDAARLSLYRLKADGVDKQILGNLASAPAKVKVELIRAAGERRINEAADILVKAAAESDREVRREALRALRETAETRHLPALLQLLDGLKTNTERNEAEAALVSVVRRYEMSGIDELVSAFGSSDDVNTRASLLTVLGRLGQPQGLDLLKAALKDDEPALQRAAILGLTEWPTPEPLADLLETARTSSVRSHSILALRGYLRLVGLPSTRSRAESVKLIEEALKLAQQDEEKRAILSLLPRFAGPEALRLAESMKEGSVAEEAQLAIERIRRSMD